MEEMCTSMWDALRNMRLSFFRRRGYSNVNVDTHPNNPPPRPTPEETLKTTSCLLFNISIMSETPVA